MALDDVFTVTHPGQQGATGSVNALHIEEYTGEVEGTIARKSALTGFIKLRTVRGTNVITNFGVGQSTLQKVTPGAPPDGTVNKFGKRSLSVDTLILARSIFPLLETFQTSYDSRAEVGQEHGKTIAKFYDQSFFIQAIKSAQLTDTAYAGLTGGGTGHSGGSQVTFAGASDYLDPAKLYASIADLFVLMENKDVDPRTDDVMIVVKPREFYALQQNEMLVNTNYVTSAGNQVMTPVLRTYGVPVISSNNFPGGASISGHLLSNSDNSNAYDGDFTKVVAVAFAPKAVMAGATIPLTTGVFWDDVYKHWYVDAWLSYGCGPNRAEFSGIILNP
jgi:hypothetical protein